MYELIQVGEHSYFMDCPAKVGFYEIGNGETVIIDSGSDKDSAKKVKKILDSHGWALKSIFNTHSHADHTGGNQYLQNQTGCKIYAPGVDCAVTKFPILEPSMLYGGFAMEELHNKFLMAKESDSEILTAEALPEGMQIIELLGHSYSMVGFRTADDVVFLADCLSSAETLEKYKIGFNYDIGAYLDTLEKVKTMEAKCFVPSHAPQTDNIAPLAQLNIDKTLETADTIKRLISEPRSFEQLLSDVFAEYQLIMNLQQRMLIGSTVKSYLSWLKNQGQVEYLFEDNMMLWRKI